MGGEIVQPTLEALVLKASELQAVPDQAERAKPGVTPTELMNARTQLAAHEGKAWIGLKQRWLVAREAISSRVQVAVVFSCGLMVLPALFATIALRGSSLFAAMGLVVQTADGERASRGRCNLRALLAWSPVLFFTIATVAGIATTEQGREWIPSWVRLHRRHGEDVSPMLLALREEPTWPALLLAVVMVVCLVHVARNPTRCIADRTAGTILVRR